MRLVQLAIAIVSNIVKGRVECVGRGLDVGIKCRVDEVKLDIDAR